MKLDYQHLLKLNIIVFLLGIFISQTLLSQSKNRPNIVWIISEDNSKHYLKLYDVTGVETPNIEYLAQNGLVFKHAFSNSPVCSASRSTLISGVYGTRVASHYHRRITNVNMPPNLKMWMNYLKDSGYHTTNDSKTDFNFSSSDMWSGSDGWKNDYGWRDRASGQPFFHSFTTKRTHESQIHFKNFSESIPFDIDKIFVEPRHPDTELFRYTGALYRKRMQEMDKDVGMIIDALKSDGLYDNTFIFYFSDHGGSLPGSKGYNHEIGLHIPLVIHVPENFEHLVDFNTGSTIDGFVSFVDFGVTVLNLAGVSIPDGFDGTPFLGENITKEQVNAADETFSYVDRLDEKYDFVRSVRKGKYKYTRNYEPFNQSGLWNSYRYNQLAFKEWRELYLKDELKDAQAAFFKVKLVEELYDIEADQYETINLSGNSGYQDKLLEMRTILSSYITNTNDLSFYPEFHLVENAFPNTSEFGINNKAQLNRLKSIADLQIQDYTSAEASIIEALSSSDAWERYWSLIVCSSFGKQALGLKDKVERISSSEEESAYNVMRALEFLALIEDVKDKKAHADAITKNLYRATNVPEALLYLNSMAMLKEKLEYKFIIDKDNLTNNIDQDAKVSNRLQYLFTLLNDSVSNVIKAGNYYLLQVDSEEVVRESGHANNVFDDLPFTFWHTSYNSQLNRNLPHEITFRLDSLYNVNGFRYLPIQNGSRNGRISKYELYASDSLISIRNSEKLIASGTWGDNDENKDVFFEESSELKFFRLVAQEDWSGSNFTTAAELRVFGTKTNVLGDISTEVPARAQLEKNTDKIYGFEIYPNPTKSYLKIKNLKNIRAEVNVLNLSGKSIKRFSINGSYELDMSSFSKGLYILEFRNEGNELIGKSKFIKN